MVNSIFYYLLLLNHFVELVRAFACVEALSRVSSSTYREAATPLQQYDATLCEKSFRELYDGYLPEWLLDKCEECGFKNPTLIQERSLNFFFEKDPNSLVIRAQVFKK